MERSLESGASLIEICVAIIIISIAVLIMAGFSRNTFKKMGGSRGADIAYIAAQNKIAELSAKAKPVSGADTVMVDGIPCVRIWSVADTAFVKRALVTVSNKLMGSGKQIIVSGALN